MAISATAGKKIYIGGKLPAQTTDFIAADFTAALAAKVPVGWVENLGTFGDEATEITFESIDTGRTQKLKGTRNAGNLALVVGFDPNDPGQQALLAAEKSPDDYAFEVEWNDAEGGGQPTVRRFVGKVMSASEAYDTVNNVIRLNVTIGINSNIVQIAAAATPPVAPTFSVDPSISGGGDTKTGVLGTFSGTLPINVATRWKLDGNIVAINVTSFDSTGLLGDLVFEVTLSNAAGSVTRASTAVTLD
ncbi:hypothetical protein ACUSIJ_24995 [Pseudochelatococcus sp. B33]